MSAIFLCLAAVDNQLHDPSVWCGGDVLCGGVWGAVVLCCEGGVVWSSFVWW